MSGGDFRAKLRRLRREEPAQAAAGGPGAAEASAVGAPDPGTGGEPTGDRATPVADPGLGGALDGAEGTEVEQAAGGTAERAELVVRSDSTDERVPAVSPRLVVPTGPAPRGELPSWLRSHLGRGARPISSGGSIDPPAGLEPVLVDGVPSRAVARTTRFEPDHRHGAWRLEAVHGADCACLSFVARDPAVAEFDSSRAVFLDIETTGLSGGAGTYPYLVALGSFAEDGRFELWQGFLREPDEERDLLREVARRVASAGQLVTFFGKSFDRHRLEDKMRLHGVAAPFESVLHLDLYHPCRRLYREGFVDGRLQTMERGLCGFERVDDLPGSMAPAAWFDFIGGRPHQLERVFDHNRDDVLSLVTLTAHLGRTVLERDADGGELEGCSLARARGMGKLAGAAGERAAELQWVERALERLEHTRGDRDHARREHLLWRAATIERLGDRARALELLVELAQERLDANAAHAWARASKLLEHHARDFDGAVEACDRASSLAARTLLGRERRMLEAEVSKRRARLEQRQADPRANSTRADGPGPDSRRTDEPRPADSEPAPN
ncbi:ribonuclease H-like domain-containing protein [Engelhardtia mirabilis]|uniref:YprB ribonuclease H-like domain-containing protein n=1 Tax=Engelhardtia mirabilis TaxID=2528011 RepID=A0A518BJR3_9BACT|nr:hypothetical protein Pla133_22980 [Planctomycetes bacterium Pla133]QDV01547.1 hypothetical protein Pla86_22980 [Planctomycetes bacterium Pla86]